MRLAASDTLYRLNCATSSLSGSSKKGKVEESRALYMQLTQQYDFGKKCVVVAVHRPMRLLLPIYLITLPLVKVCCMELFHPRSFSGSNPVESNSMM